MTGRIFTADHQVYDLPPLLAWNVKHTGTVPCDSWSVTAVYKAEMAPVLKLAAGFAAMEKGTVQLRGIVDEYEVELGSGGLTVTLSGRGYAARLLDNESRPVTYEQVTLRELIRCHAEPYGITCGAAADLRSTVPYTAGAGVSQWKVISEFCRTCGGFLPRFAKTGELLAVPEKDDGKRIVIDDSSPVLECRIREDHYGVLTEAHRQKAECELFRAEPEDDRQGRPVPPGDIHTGAEHLGCHALHGGISDQPVPAGGGGSDGEAAGKLRSVSRGPGGAEVGKAGHYGALPGGGGGKPFLRPRGGCDDLDIEGV